MKNVLHTRPATSTRPRPGILSLIQLLLTWICHLTVTYASPLLPSRSNLLNIRQDDEDEPKPPDDPTLWIYLGTAMALVLIGGAFAGLTIALMGQDEIYLQVISESGEGAEKKYATRVLKLLKRGKHWVLVTLLVGNVITNETLPIVLDRSIGGGYAAAITSTVLVIVFGEIVPQSLCVRFGLPIGAWMAPFVLLLMWIFAPITWPIAKLLDRILGEDHGTTYKKAGLKTLVTLHKTMVGGGERLNQDEVSIITGVLDLKAKPVGKIMTPMNDVFTLSADSVLDEDLMDQIMAEGYSRIPVHDPHSKSDFIGMLLVKMLITYDPEDCAKVTDFALATLPETRPETSCLDIINFFQEGKSHMVLVSDYPGEPVGALGVVTLEDVIEELIGEEIIDESDVYIDVHKAIRRINPAPTYRHRSRVSKGEVVTDVVNSQAKADEHLLDADGQIKENGEVDEPPDEPTKRYSSASFEFSRSPTPRAHTFRMRRTSSHGSAADFRTVQMRPYTNEMKQQLRSLGPSNAASQPKSTRINTVKVKPGVGTVPEHRASFGLSDGEITSSPRVSTSTQTGTGPDGLRSGHSTKDAVQALQVGQGKLERPTSSRGRNSGTTKSKGVQANASSRSRKMVSRTASHSTLGSIHSIKSSSSKPPPVRTGSITEHLVESSGGVRKMVLELTSSSEDDEDGSPISPTTTRGSRTPNLTPNLAPAPLPSQRRVKSHDGTRETDDKQPHLEMPDFNRPADENPEKGSSRQKRKKRRKQKEEQHQEQQPPVRESTDEANNDENTPLLYE